MAKRKSKLTSKNNQVNNNDAVMVENQNIITENTAEIVENDDATHKNANLETTNSFNLITINTNNKKTKTKSIDPDKKIHRTPSVPIRYRSVANATSTILRQWAANHSAFTCIFVDYNVLTTENDKLILLLKNSTLQKTGKTDNTGDLAETNKNINKTVTILKNHIKSEFPAEPNVANIYFSYGLIQTKSGLYILPRDNHERKAALDILINKLQERNNTIATKQFGLREWQSLQSQHSAQWQNSETLRSNRSGDSKELVAQYEIVRDLINVLHKYISIAYRKENVKQIHRSFGFLKESF